jgi:phosphinothricin acetyltransferase
MSATAIRLVEPDDLEALLEIYNHFVLTTHVTFDIEPRTLAQRRIWLDQFRPDGRHQCFVAVRNGVAIGWAASQRFKDRAAYDTSVETSVYLAPGEEGKGYGRRLYDALFAALAREDVHCAFAGIALPNEPSVGLHSGLGFTYVGTYKEVGRKFGRFWDVAWYRRPLGSPLATS